MASSRKKVIIRTIENVLLPGYLQSAHFVDQSSGSPTIAVLDLAGRIVALGADQVRYIAFVRDFNLHDSLSPERLSRRAFLSRPRTEGLWVRITFTGGEMIEGLASLDISLLDSLIDDRGLFLIPPDVRSNTQRLFVPRSSIAAVQLLAVITTPSKVKLPAASKSISNRRKDIQDLPFPEPPAR